MDKFLGLRETRRPLSPRAQAVVVVGGTALPRYLLPPHGLSLHPSLGIVDGHTPPPMDPSPGPFFAKQLVKAAPEWVILVWEEFRNLGLGHTTTRANVIIQNCCSACMQVNMLPDSKCNAFDFGVLSITCPECIHVDPCSGEIALQGFTPERDSVSTAPQAKEVALVHKVTKTGLR